MKRFYDLPYRIKLLVTHLGSVLLTVMFITSLVTLSASNHMRENSTANLYLLTEQVLINFESEVETAERYLYSMSVSSGTARMMGKLATEEEIGRQEYLEMVYDLSKMIDSHAPYDHVTVRLKNGELVSSDTYDTYVTDHGKKLLSNPDYLENRYGESLWTRTEDGEVYLIRDVYDTSPLRHVGKMCAHVRQSELVSMSGYNKKQNCTVMFFDQNGRMIVSVGEQEEGLEEAAGKMFSEPADVVEIGENTYVTCRLVRGDWTAVGFMPMEIVENLQRSVLQSGLLAAILGILMGTVVAVTFSRQMSEQISRLVESMNCVEAGDLDVFTPVQSRDEIGMLTDHFNRMTAKTRELLTRVIQEQNSKQQAEYMNLEYEYRFLQWQVNPHFIYNALETINALAKMDGNDELSDMIVLLSEYFRKNAEAIRKKFVTVSQEFASLEQYAQIYCAIYGRTLDVHFEIEPEAERAFLPTMIIQPLLENALVHGTRSASDTTIVTSACADEGRLVVRIEDNGPGMTKKTIESILGPRSTNAGDESRASLGVRNVLERMHLLYGEAGSMSIESEPGRGTRVCVRLPLSYEEKQQPFTVKRLQ